MHKHKTMARTELEKAKENLVTEAKDVFYKFCKTTDPEIVAWAFRRVLENYSKKRTLLKKKREVEKELEEINKKLK